VVTWTRFKTTPCLTGEPSLSSPDPSGSDEEGETTLHLSPANPFWVTTFAPLVGDKVGGGLGGVVVEDGQEGVAPPVKTVKWVI
jgi:hypothetical protein